MFTPIYKIIKTRLETITELKEVDWFLNQYNTSDKSGMLLTLPGAYIQFHPTATQALARGIQKSDGSVSIHLVTDSVISTGKRMKNDAATDHAVIFDEIYKTLDGTKGMMSDLGNVTVDQIIFNTLTRDQITPSHDLKSKIISIQRFKATFFDYSKNKNYQKYVTSLQVDTE